MQKQDLVQWRCVSKLSKYREDIEPYRGKEAEFYKLFKPYEVIEMEGNALLNAGIDLIWDLVTGTSAAHFDTANFKVAVYIVDTWVNGVSDGGYPTSSAQAVTFKASWTGASGDGVWSKWRVTNGTIAMNEKTEALGTKSGGTWTLEVSITLS